MEMNEGEISEVECVVESSEPEPGINGHDNEKSGAVGVTLLEKVDPYLLADPCVVSGWEGKELGAVESVKVTCSGLVIFVCVSSDQREWALRVTQLGSRSVSCFALRNRTLLK